MARPRYGGELHLRVDAETDRKIKECLDADRAQKRTVHRLTVSKSTVVRDAIDMYHQHKVLDHSFIARSDPRFND